MRPYGYGDRLDRVKTVEPDASANRVEYRRDGITEWYENGPLGLEQGFTLTHRPGKPHGQALTLELGLRGDLLAALEPAGKGLEVKDKDGKRTLLYTGLVARDATGRELPSWLEVRGERLLVRMEDRGAHYPVVVDPLIQQAGLRPSDGAGADQFGYSVAISGTTLAVGARNHTVGSNSGRARHMYLSKGAERGANRRNGPPPTARQVIFLVGPLRLPAAGISVYCTPPISFVLRKNGAGWEECKTQDELVHLSRQSQNRYCSDDGTKWRCPPGETYAASHGLYYRVRSSRDIDWNFSETSSSWRTTSALTRRCLQQSVMP